MSKKRPYTKRSVRVVVVRVPDADQLEILLGEHVEGSVKAHHLGFPGGGIKRRERPEDAGMREVLDETALKVRIISPVWDFAALENTLRVDGTRVKSHYMVALAPKACAPAANHEMVALGFRPREEIRALLPAMMPSDQFAWEAHVHPWLLKDLPKLLKRLKT